MVNIFKTEKEYILARLWNK